MKIKADSLAVHWAFISQGSEAISPFNSFIYTKVGLAKLT